MKRLATTMIAAALAIGSLTGAAAAGDRWDRRDDRREMRQEHRHDRRELKQDHRRDRREMRRDHRSDRRELRRDQFGRHRSPYVRRLIREALADGRMTTRERLQIRRAIEQQLRGRNGTIRFST